MPARSLEDVMTTHTEPWILSNRATARLRDHAYVIALNLGADTDLAEDVAQITVLRLNEAAARNPAARRLLHGDDWASCVSRVTSRTLAAHRVAESERLRSERALDSIQDLADERNDLEELIAVMAL